MRVTIHRGINQIGGCITEIATNKTRIIIDLGQNLPKGNIPSDDNMANRENIEDLIIGVNAIFYTHYHGDHVELFKYVPKGIAQYIGEVAKRVMLCKYEALIHIPENAPVKAEDIQLLESFKTFREKQEIPVNNDIKVTPYFVSHSACDAYMFLIEADGKRILHTGDFRDHGYLGKGLMQVLEKIILPKGAINVLITEGTMLSRSTEKVLHENDIKLNAIELMRQYKYVFVLCSSTDVDRLVSFYQAAQETGRSFLYDNYQKNVLNIFTETKGTIHELFRFDNGHYYKHGHKKQLDILKGKGFCMLVRPKHYNQIKELLTQLPEKQILFIYSMWSGYLNEGENQKEEYVKIEGLFNDRVKRLHTSGHATPETLAAVCSLVNPTTAIIPIHSEDSEKFRELPIIEDLRNKIVAYNGTIHL
ncbi:MBL fold metallo-hydrolase [Bacteroides sp. 519]|uniref:MBL fold metallo-hydrolase n=1 Tax=Bacteroides sp. 519 TaxID=2302937 RepID=UPI0013D35F92|nr:MBL fold metallo-hydrolase [Bacteroides sp. 519]NDV58887.1 MBL fold metallo-hydrolase [Bacteroides sp. 519]